jgi:hypothetical protein
MTNTDRTQKAVFAPTFFDVFFQVGDDITEMLAYHYRDCPEHGIGKGFEICITRGDSFLGKRDPAHLKSLIEALSDELLAEIAAKARDGGEEAIAFIMAVRDGQPFHHEWMTDVDSDIGRWVLGEEPPFVACIVQPDGTIQLVPS